MQNQRQGVRSTKRVLTPNPSFPPPVETGAAESRTGATNLGRTLGSTGSAAQISEPPANILGKSQGAAGGAADTLDPLVNKVKPIEKKQDIFITLYKPRSNMFTYQIGIFPR